MGLLPAFCLVFNLLVAKNQIRIFIRYLFKVSINRFYVTSCSTFLSYELQEARIQSRVAVANSMSTGAWLGIFTGPLLICVTFGQAAYLYGINF